VHALRRHRHTGGWIALLAVLAGLLLPSLSMSAGGGARLAWVEVCTALGAQLVPVPADLAGPELLGAAAGEAATLQPGMDADGGGEAPGALLHLALDHCPWCTLGAHGALPAPPAPCTGLALARHDAPVEVDSATPRATRAACSAQPRAPPSRT